jgi:excisionase family DNA binding protein
MDDQPQFLTIEELATKSRLSVGTLRRLKDAGKIPFYQPGGKGGRILFAPDAIERTQPVTPAPSTEVDQTKSASPRLSGPRPGWMRNHNNNATG